MYRHGFELPEFAKFTLLEKANAMAATCGVFRDHLDVVAEFGLSFLLAGINCRASHD